MITFTKVCVVEVLTISSWFGVWTLEDDLSTLIGLDEKWKTATGAIVSLFKRFFQVTTFNYSFVCRLLAFYQQLSSSCSSSVSSSWFKGPPCNTKPHASIYSMAFYHYLA